MNDILQMSVAELSQRLHTRELSSKEVTTAYLEQIRAKDPEIGALSLIHI